MIVSKKALLLTSVLIYQVMNAESWQVSGQNAWQKINAKSQNVQIQDGLVSSDSNSAVFRSALKRVTKKSKATTLVLKQSDSWNNWQKVPRVGPKERNNAPVFLPIKDGDYWLFSINSKLDKKKNGYHAWHSSDMKSWTHYGAISDYRSRWVTTAEHIDGKTYIYYDNPNDQDPHLIIDSNLKDGKMGKDMGMVFKDPSDGSDCSIIRDTDGKFHLIYEDWSPINASKHAWDSPLAGYAVSPDGIKNWQIKGYAVDERTKPTGKKGKYKHGFTKANKGKLTFQEHSPIQNAYGDWTSIKIGQQYYLFGDFDAAEHSVSAGNSKGKAQAAMSVARFTSDSLSKKFEYCGNFGAGHPDPTVGFAEGQFYLLTQTSNDFISSGPWVSGVKARVGVDVNGDGKVDKYTAWTTLSEDYRLKKGYSRVVERSPAKLDLSSLPAGLAFCFEIKLNKNAESKVMPQIKSARIDFK